MELVLLFNNCAAAHNVARVHASTCPLVAAAKASRGAVRVTTADDETIADLNERGFPVKFCKCTKGVR